MSAVVEGVEAAEQFKEFKMHCDVDRGYYLSEPLLAQSLGAPSYCNPFLTGFAVESRSLGAVLYAQELIGGTKVLLDGRFR